MKTIKRLLTTSLLITAIACGSSDPKPADPNQNKTDREILIELYNAIPTDQRPDWDVDVPESSIGYWSGVTINGEGNVTALLLEEVGLTSLPESIGYLSDLESLVLTKNDLVTLPESIGKLTKLTNFILENNALTSLPESIGDL